MPTKKQSVLLFHRLCPEHTCVCACLCDPGRAEQNGRKEGEACQLGQAAVKAGADRHPWAPTVCSEHFHFLSSTMPGGSCYLLAVTSTPAWEEVEPGQGHTAGRCRAGSGTQSSVWANQ